MAWSFRKPDGAAKTSVTVNAPAGAVMDYAGAVAPDGWLLCDGSVVSQAAYSNLYSVIGATYNTGGEGAGNFRLPDARGRVAVHPDAGAGRVTSNNTLAATDGAEEHTLSVTELPSHNHSGTSGGPSNNTSTGPSVASTGTTSANHTHTQQGTFGSGGVSANHQHFPSNSQGFVTGPINQTNLTTGGALSRWLGQSFAPGGVTSTETADHGHFTTISGQTGGQSADHSHSLQGHTHDLQNHTHSISSQGGDGPHNNLQPYIILNKIIKH